MYSRFIGVMGLLLVLGSAWATGPSYAEVPLVPIGCNDDGALLLKTRYVVNRTGTHGLVLTEYGWLAVSASGFWEKHFHARFDPDSPDSGFETLQALDDEFASPMNWESPPASVVPLLKRYGFDKSRGALEDERISVEELRERLGQCADCDYRQRSVNGLSATVSADTHLKVVFSLRGVVVLKNVRNEDEDIGSRFAISNEMDLGDGVRRDYGIDYQDIDAILIAP